MPPDRDRSHSRKVRRSPGGLRAGVTESGPEPDGTWPKTVLTEASGQVQVQVPRDRDGTFEPQIVRKRQRR